MKNNLTNLGWLVLRAGPGLLLMRHGYQKLTAYNDILKVFKDPIGLGSNVALSLVIFSEFFCALLIVLGLFTRLAAIPVIITFCVVVFHTHAQDAMDVKELGIVYLLYSIAMLLGGSGKYSLDRLIFKNRFK